LRLTAESLAGRRNRISTVTVRRVEQEGADHQAAAAGRQRAGAAAQAGPAENGMTAGDQAGRTAPADGEPARKSATREAAEPRADGRDPAGGDTAAQ